MYELPLSTEEYRLQRAKQARALLREAIEWMPMRLLETMLLQSLEWVQPHRDPFETDEGGAAYSLRDRIKGFLES